MDRPLLLYWSFTTGLIGGLLILLGALLMTFMMAMMGTMMPMMGQGQWMDRPGMGFLGMGFWMLSWGAATGAVVLLGAAQVRQGQAPLAWGVTMVVAGVLSYLAMGGFLVGGLAAIAAGVMALMAAGPGTQARPAGRRRA